MALEFIFATPDKTDYKNLHQGDILHRNKELIDALLQAHGYYANADDYTHFMVLTQSCDLQLRNGKPKARYISLAAVRPLDIVVERLINKYAFKDFDFPLPVCDKSQEVFVRQTLERLLHNTEDGFFFIRKKSHPAITKDLCVFLPLSVAIRNTHYDACLSAKVAQLDNIFQAKLGWLVGNLYSRVGTPDLEEHESDPDKFKEDFLDEVIYKKSAWLIPQQLKILKQKKISWVRDNPGIEQSEEDALALIQELPDIMEVVSNRVIQQLTQANFLANEAEIKEKVRNLLINDRVLKNIIISPS